MVKKGDTLIEVTLAVGIFSMIAIAIVAVMSSSTAGAQLSLESTLTRQEIDTQAEALRFIHAAYVSDRDSNNDNLTYIKLWKAIIERANDLSKNQDNDSKDTIIKYTPSSCDELYDNNEGLAVVNAFIINPRALGNLPQTTEDDIEDKGVIFKVNEGKHTEKFRPAQTYPHLIYGSDVKTPEPDSLVSGGSNTTLFKAEGIFIVPVRDEETTILSDGNEDKKTEAFYDFYIRTCWYGTDAETPSTISTVIRLYDPDAIPKSQAKT